MRSRSGFTLLEVVIALAIVAGALVVILHSHFLSVNLANRATGISLATLLAQEKMEKIMGGEFPEKGEDKGVFKEYPDFHWRSVVSEAELFGEEIDDLRKVTVTIFWFDGRDKQTLEVVSYLFRRGQ